MLYYAKQKRLNYMKFLPGVGELLPGEEPLDFFLCFFFKALSLKTLSSELIELMLGDRVDGLFNAEPKNDPDLIFLIRFI